MTDLRQAAQQALEALTIYSDAQCSLKGQAAITALRTALAQQAEPTCPECKAKVLFECVACSSNNYPPQQQAEPPLEWLLIKNILDEYGLDAIAFVAEWKAAQQQAEPVQERITRIAWDERGVRTVNGIPDDAPQRPWQGLTDGDWEWVADKKETSLDTFAHGAAWAAEQLKERNKERMN